MTLLRPYPPAHLSRLCPCHGALQRASSAIASLGMSVAPLSSTDALRQSFRALANSSTQGIPTLNTICQRCSAKGFNRTNSLQLIHRRSQSTHTNSGRRITHLVDSGPLSPGVVDAVGSISPRATSVDIKAVQQAQMLSDFLNSHFPTAEAKANLSARCSYLAILPDLSLSSPVLQGAVETLCFAYLGSKYDDARLTHQSQTSYGKVLKSLVRAISAPAQEAARHKQSDILASIMLLCMYDDSIPHQHQSVTGWAAHYWGALQFLQAHGPTCMDLSKPFDRLLLINLRIPALFIGIAQRKAILIGEPRWRAIYARNPAKKKSLAGLYDKAICMPGLLERTDKIVGRKNTIEPHHVQRLCEDLVALRRALLYWSEHESRDDSNEHFPVVGVSDLNAFDMDLEEHVFMTANSTFQTFHQFPNYHVAEERTLYWTFSLVYCCMLLRMLHFFSAASAHLDQLTRQDLERETYLHASNLCQSLYYFSKYDSLAMVRWTDLHLLMAQNLFEELGALREVGWCQGARCAIKLRIDRLTPLRARSLCRIGDITPGFALITHYKMRNVLDGQRCPVHTVT